MKFQFFLFRLAVGILLASITAASLPPSPYSVNIHFIPPVVGGRCNFGEFWSPPNMKCAQCFCLGAFSRCVPKPGCDPNKVTTTTVAPAPDTGANVKPATNASTISDSTANPVLPQDPAELESQGSPTSNTEPSTTPTSTKPSTTPTSTKPSTTPSSTKPDQRKSRSPRFRRL